MSPKRSNEVISSRRAGLRRLVFMTVFVSLSGSGILLFADFLWRSDLYALNYALLILFAVLFTYLSFGATTALFGYSARLRGVTAGVIDAREARLQGPLPPTAILFPVYNEDPARVVAGLRATLASLRKTGHEERFHFFILSDTRDPDKWLQEEAAWLAACRDFNAHGRIFYRHRRENLHKKAGNISDFLSRWGKRYRYMVIFDADSLMSGACLVQLVALMEQHPRAGIIQTVPGIVEGQTHFARAQQFASRLYGPVFAAGLNYWQQGEGNYWGHNAIIRVEAFMAHCELPDLPWREPLGGKILSHDFVEAALMRRAGYEVWLAANLEESYEEGPPNAVEAAKRDRRWCQGNLQHAWLLFAKGFHAANRIHLLNGILSYTSAFFWFWFLVISTLVVVQFENSQLTLLTTPGFMRFFDLDLRAHGILIMGFTALLLFAPKILALLDLTADPERLRGFGGLAHSFRGVLAESLFSALQAPINMIWHATFVVLIPMGKSSGWNAQNRDGSAGLGFRAALRIFGWMTLAGLLWAVLAWRTSTDFFAWVAPVLLPMIASVPLAMASSSKVAAQKSQRVRLWQTPEEASRPEILRLLDDEHQRATATIAQRDGDERFDRGPSRRFAAEAIVHPLLHAMHAALELEEGPADPAATPQAQALADRWQGREVPVLSDAEWRHLLGDPGLLQQLHRRWWTAG